jgi:hypothetical protein
MTSDRVAKDRPVTLSAATMGSETRARARSVERAIRVDVMFASGGGLYQLRGQAR